MREPAKPTGTQRADNDDANFQLLRYFSSASLLAFVLVALLLGYVFRALSVDSLVNGYQSEHINHARLISNELWDRHFESLVQSANDLSAEQLAKAAEIPALHQHVSKLLEGTKIFKIKVYSLKGRTVYSTELNEIGEEKFNNAGVIAGMPPRC
jgi:hypothetical protein